METLWIVLAAVVTYLTLWTYFDACRQRDAYQTGLGPRGLPPNTWAALVFFFAPIAAPLYLKAKDALAYESSPRNGAPPVFESRGLNVYGWLGLSCFLGATGWLAWEKEPLLAALTFVMAAVAAFGGRTIRSTDRALKVDLPAGAAWEQVGFRPLPREQDRPDEAEEELVVNLDRVAPPSRPLAASYPPSAPPLPIPAAPRPAAPPAASPVFEQPALAPARTPAALVQSSVRISDIVWAASEDNFDEGGTDEPALPGGANKHATVAADPALFRQLGGIFAPPGAAAPPRLPPAPAPAMPAAAPARPLAAPVSPAGPPTALPPRVPPSAAGGSAASAPKRTAPPLAGAYASSSSESKLPQIVATAVLLVLLIAGGWFFLGRRQPPSAEEVRPEVAPVAEIAPAETRPPPAETSAEDRRPERADPLEAARAWMLHYLDFFGPLGQNLDEIDFEGFSEGRCAQLRSNLDRVSGLPALPDEQLHFELGACVLMMSYLPEDCANGDIPSWCGHLTEARSCLHGVQQNIEAKWGLPGLLEFQISETEPRSTSSMSGRCMADQIEARSRAVDP